MTKELIRFRHDQMIKAGDMTKFELLSVPISTKLYEMLNIMKEKHTHIALIVDALKKPTGICTMEDLIEELLQTPIIDEFDSLSLNPERQLKIAKAIHSLGLEENIEVVARKSIDAILKRKSEHTEEISRRKSHEASREKFRMNKETKRVSFDISEYDREETQTQKKKSSFKSVRPNVDPNSSKSHPTISLNEVVVEDPEKQLSDDKFYFRKDSK